MGSGSGLPSSLCYNHGCAHRHSSVRMAFVTATLRELTVHGHGVDVLLHSGKCRTA